VRIGKWILILFVDELEAEQAPFHFDVADLLDLPDPFGGLPCPRA
jgi:hypothetical protein